MTQTEEYVPVTFENSLGETISNDPVWKARETLAAYQAANPNVRIDDSNEAFDSSPYSDMKGSELKIVAKEKGVDIAGAKTVGEVRRLLEAFDAEQADAATKAAADEAAAKAASDAEQN